MRKILEDLYFGNIVPYEKRIAADSELRHLVKRAADCETRLVEQLNDAEMRKNRRSILSSAHSTKSTAPWRGNISSWDSGWVSD